MASIAQGRAAYTVRHKTSNGEKLESCFYATDAFEARLLAMEFNAYIRQHPELHRFDPQDGGLRGARRRST